MSQESGTPTRSAPAAPVSWSKVWTSAVTQPSVATYERIARDPNAASSTAYRWVFVTALIGSLMSVVLALALGGSDLDFATFFCGALILSILSLVAFAIMSGLTHMIARALEGTGSYDELAYALAAYIAPLTLITSALGSLPVLVYLVLPLGLYGLALNVTAVKATHRFTWGRAIASSLGLLIFACVAAVAVIAVLTLVGNAVQDVFSNITQELNAPR